MPITPVDYDPFASDFDVSGPFTRPTNPRPVAPRQPQMMTEPPPIDEAAVHASQARMQTDPGVRTARGLVRRGQQAEQDMIFRDLRQRFINNPQALSMLKYLEAQQQYGQQANNAIAQMAKSMVPQAPQTQPGASIMPTGPATQQPQGQIPQQRQYQAMRPRPGMVVNGYRLVNPAKPNDRASWQPVTEK